MSTSRVSRLAAAWVLLLGLAGAGADAVSVNISQHVFFRVQAPASLTVPVSGRLLVFVKHGAGDKEVDMDMSNSAGTSVTAAEVHDLAPGGSVEIDGDALSFPTGLSALSAGDYEAQAVLDVDHSYNYAGRSPRDWISGVLTLAHWTPGEGSEPTMVLSAHPEPSPEMQALAAKYLAATGPGVAEKVEMRSPLLSAFWGREVDIKAWIMLPPGYADHPKLHYPTVYWTHGFGGNLEKALWAGSKLRDRMVAGSMPPMIWVMLDESVPQGTHEFADSANNGPWGTALTGEFIPLLESKYRMDAKPQGRLLNGHSSGGWATLQLQINYPKLFGGTWSTSPDPSDFHNFTGPDLYAAHANVYRGADGSQYPIMRDQGKVLATLEGFARLETVINPYGGQMSSFEWVFSPKGTSGSPQPMFDRSSGDVDPQVLSYWHDHYDLANLVERRWRDIGHDLKGRIHVMVGTADTFYLDGAVHLFENRLAKLGANPHFSYFPDKTHFDLYAQGTDRGALFDQISAEMYAVARPGQPWKPITGPGASGAAAP